MHVEAAVTRQIQNAFRQDLSIGGDCNQLRLDTPEVLTKIYGEEDWSATIRKVDEDAEEMEGTSNVISLESRQPHRDRMAGLT